jgi:acetylornithine/succinyldiaminopimelate/putrescine aminotransferase
MEKLQKLNELREKTGAAKTVGLPSDIITKFLGMDKKLAQAIDDAYENFQTLSKQYPELLKLEETDLIAKLQDGIVNFYPEAQTNPYVAIAAGGPWIVTSHGAVLHDSGGYGMLGFGHEPAPVIETIGKRYVMANVMTASFSQRKLVDKLNASIGKGRAKPPFGQYIFMNSGSEAVTVATRITDLNAAVMTNPGGPHAGKKIMFLGLKGGFHGRTDRPAQVSSSSKSKYQLLASFRDNNVLHEVEPNNVAELKGAFEWAKKENVFFEGFFIEPVMGEGDPGKAITPEFFKAARELTKANNTLFIVDSIQAAIRTHGCLSITDYPGFENLEGPDMETYSKAMNAGQFPLSILAMNESTAKIYQRGIYGNTMTANPRALEVASTVMDMLTPEVVQNINDRGQEFMEKFGQLKSEFPDIVTKIQGTGLLCSIDVNPKVFDVVGFGALEEYMRINGIGVIHGGANSLRFTPHFRITTQEVDLVIDQIRQAFKNGPKKK